MNNVTVIYGDTLQHHGVLGMKWGVRRYQNYDGSYTRAGMKRYNASKAQYESDKDRYKAVKKAYGVAKKNGGSFIAPDGSGKVITVHKDQVHNAKINMKQSERKMNKDYKHLKQDKMGDKGKELYANGYRITGKQKVMAALATAGSMTIAAAAIAKNNGKIPLGSTGFSVDMPYQLRSVLTKYGKEVVVAGGTLIGASAVGSAVTYNKDRNLRAYYTHTSNY